MTCCAPTTPAEHSNGDCPSCNAKGSPVEPLTVKALLNVRGLYKGPVGDPRFCATAACPVVYFENAGHLTFTEDDLTVRVHAKHPAEGDVPVCYCFNVTASAIQHEIKLTGTTEAGELITRQVRAGRCACEVKNPRGVCCLGDVLRVEQALTSPGHGTASEERVGGVVAREEGNGPQENPAG